MNTQDEEKLPNINNVDNVDNNDKCEICCMCKMHHKSRYKLILLELFFLDRKCSQYSLCLCFY